MTNGPLDAAEWSGDDTGRRREQAIRRAVADALCGHTFLSGPCVRMPGHEPPHRDAHGCEWQGVTSLDLAPQREAPNAD